MPRDLTIVMYHYVRDFSRTRYPRIKGLDVSGFRRQLDHLTDNFTVIRMEDVIEAACNDADLPPNAALLTFDDGYAEHYDVAFPILHDRGLQGSFFPPVAPVRDGTLLDVNRVHFILASTDSAGPLADAIDDHVATHRAEYELDTVEQFRERWAEPNRFDDAQTIYVKRMLQTALPIELRERIAKRLFAEFVSVDEAAFAAELYLTRDQARVMVSNEMYFGSHGVSHFWLNHVDRDTQVAEVDGSVEFLRDLGMPVDDHWVMCYPFGGWNDSLLDVLEDRGCSVGLATEVRTASIGTDNRLTLPRFDTNDFPQ